MFNSSRIIILKEWIKKFNDKKKKKQQPDVLCIIYIYIEREREYLMNATICINQWYSKKIKE